MIKIKVPCMIFSRITGYYSDSNTWNLGKKSEKAQRKSYSIEKAMDAIYKEIR
jgi:hypothetical protein